jgi:glutamate racemase
MGPDVVLVSSADETAFAVRALLDKSGLAESSDRVGEHRFYSSGDPAWFAHLGSRLFGPELTDAQSWSA